MLLRWSILSMLLGECSDLLSVRRVRGDLASIGALTIIHTIGKIGSQMVHGPYSAGLCSHVRLRRHRPQHWRLRHQRQRHQRQHRLQPVFASKAARVTAADEWILMKQVRWLHTAMSAWVFLQLQTWAPRRTTSTTVRMLLCCPTLSMAARRTKCLSWPQT